MLRTQCKQNVVRRQKFKIEVFQTSVSIRSLFPAIFMFCAILGVVEMQLLTSDLSKNCSETLVNFWRKVSFKTNCMVYVSFCSLRVQKAWRVLKFLSYHSIVSVEK